MTGPDGHQLSQHPAGFHRTNWDMAVAVFIMPIAVQWWAVWYPGAEPGGGSYIAQRMLASKSERDSLGGSCSSTSRITCCARGRGSSWPCARSSSTRDSADIQKAFPNSIRT